MEQRLNLIQDPNMLFIKGCGVLATAIMAFALIINSK